MKVEEKIKYLAKWHPDLSDIKFKLLKKDLANILDKYDLNYEKLSTICNLLEWEENIKYA